MFRYLFSVLTLLPLTALFITGQLQARVYSIQFSIAEEKIVKSIPKKRSRFCFYYP